MGRKGKDAWEAYRADRRRMLATIPIIVLAWPFLPRLTERLMGSEAVGIAVCVAPVVLLIVFNERLTGFTCPRCKEPFFHGAFMIDTTSKKCIHCALPFGTKHELTTDEATTKTPNDNDRSKAEL